MNRGLVACIVVMWIAPEMTAQTLDNPRSIGLGAYGAVVNDLRAFGANAAGLTGLRDWELVTSTYTAVGVKDAGFVFQGFSLGKRVGEHWAAAIAYTPGTSLRFGVPPTLFVGEGNTPASRDLELQYDEPVIAALAYRFTDGISASVGTRFVRERLTATTYEIVIMDTVAFPVASSEESRGSFWGIDASVLWSPVAPLTISLTGKNLFAVAERRLPEEFRTLELPDAPLVEASVAYRISPTILAAGGVASDGYGAVGYELALPAGLAFRNGFYLNGDADKVLEGFSVGIGWTYEFVSLDASYLGFTDKSTRKGEGILDEFDPADITRIDLNPYTSDRVSLSIRAMFGKVRESLARIESVEMLGGIYPSAAEALAYRPVGRARVKNTSGKPIQARVGFVVERYMDEPTETAPVYISPGETLEIPFSAVFNDRLRGVERMVVSDGQVFVTATPAEAFDDRTKTPVLIHGRNAWSGDVYALRYFVTPDDPEVLRYSRDVLLQERSVLDSVPRELESFTRAQVLIGTFSGKLMSMADPRQSADYVQYPAETLRHRSGDCDDMTVLFSSLLSSIGISTSFVEVLPPGEPERNHIYLMFDTGLSPKFGHQISTNPKRFVVRRNKNGGETIWIPIETTVANRGFDAAWSKGAQQYFDDVELGLGVVKGWVKVIDVN